MWCLSVNIAEAGASRPQPVARSTPAGLLLFWSISVVLVLSLAAPTMATNVSGYQWGTWTAANSPYVLTGSVTVPKSEPLTTDYDSDGVWDDAEPYTDTNGNGHYDNGEPYADSNGNGHWDPAEAYTDWDGDGIWTAEMSLAIDAGVQVQTGSWSYQLVAEGTLQATAATFHGVDSNRQLQLNVRSGGEANLTDCTFTGTETYVIYESGSRGAVDGCTGDWSLFMNSSSVLLTGALSMHTLGLAAPAIVSGATITQLTLSASATVTGCMIGYIILSAGIPTVAGNTITYPEPLYIVDPDAQTTGFSGNTFTDDSARIWIGGSLEGTRALAPIDGLAKYELVASLTISDGASLTIDPGVQVQTGSSLYQVFADGVLQATGATFHGVDSNRQLQLNVRSGGQANLTDCTFTGTETYVIYETGSQGTVNGCMGSWSLFVSSSDVVLGGALSMRILSLGTPVTVSGATITQLTLSASATVTGCTIGYINLSVGVPMVFGNTITYPEPLYIVDPDAQTTGFSGNTFIAGSARIRISGTLQGTRALAPIDGLAKYDLAGSLTISDGASLTIDPGVQVQTGSSLYQVFADGVLQATGATFHGVDSNRQLQLNVRSGGQANLTDCTFTGTETYVIYETGSQGAVNGCTGNWSLFVSSSGVALGGGLSMRILSFGAPVAVSGATITQLTLSASATVTGCTIGYINLSAGIPTVSGNTITSAAPLYIVDPDAQTTGFSGNTFTDAAARIQIGGSLEGTRVLAPIDGLAKYELVASLTSASGASLTIDPGVQVQTGSSFYKVMAYGVLQATGATFHGVASDRQLQVNVWSAGEANLTDCTFTGTETYVIYESGSQGAVECNSGSLALFVPGNSTVAIVNNDFANARAFATGAGGTINLAGNWWGTTDPVAIAAKITDCNDNPSYPCADFEPFLTGPADCGDCPLGDALASLPASSTAVTVVPYDPNYGRLVGADGDISSDTFWVLTEDGWLLEYNGGTLLRSVNTGYLLSRGGIAVIPDGLAILESAASTNIWKGSVSAENQWVQTGWTGPLGFIPEEPTDLDYGLGYYYVTTSAGIRKVAPDTGAWVGVDGTGWQSIDIIEFRPETFCGPMMQLGESFRQMTVTGYPTETPQTVALNPTDPPIVGVAYYRGGMAVVQSTAIELHPPLSPLQEKMKTVYPDADGDGAPDTLDQCPNTIPGVTVDAVGCPAEVPADFDRDGDVDSVDLSLFEACASGPAIPYATGCDAKDLDPDADVDQADFGIFQRCFSGESEPADPRCAS